MDDELMDQIRDDLDKILDEGGYAFSHPLGKPNVVLKFLHRVTWEKRKACEDLLLEYGVAYEIED